MCHGCHPSSGVLEFLLRRNCREKRKRENWLTWLYLNKWFLFPLAGWFRKRAIWKTTLEKQPSLFVQMQKHSRVALWSLEINITGGGVHTSESKIISTSNTKGRKEARSTRKGKWNIVSKKYKYVEKKYKAKNMDMCRAAMDTAVWFWLLLSIKAPCNSQVIRNRRLYSHLW